MNKGKFDCQHKLCEACKVLSECDRALIKVKFRRKDLAERLKWIKGDD